MKAKPIKAIPQLDKHIEKGKSYECSHWQEVKGHLQKSNAISDEVIINVP